LSAIEIEVWRDVPAFLQDNCLFAALPNRGTHPLIRYKMLAGSQGPGSTSTLPKGARCMSEAIHPSAPHDLPAFITAPGDTDTLMVVVGIILIATVLMVGNLYLRLHALPEQMAHKSQKLQFEIVAVLGLLALFTHIHLFWVIGLLLAMIDLPDWGTPLRSIAGSVKQIAGDEATEMAGKGGTHGVAAEGPHPIKAGAAKSEVQSHA
jgi:hypothetical protein